MVKNFGVFWSRTEVVKDRITLENKMILMFRLRICGNNEFSKGSEIQCYLSWKLFQRRLPKCSVYLFTFFDRRYVSTFCTIFGTFIFIDKKKKNPIFHSFIPKFDVLQGLNLLHVGVLNMVILVTTIVCFVWPRRPFSIKKKKKIVCACFFLLSRVSLAPI